MTRYRIGVDIGGTFTDFVLEDTVKGTLKLGKILTTPDDPSNAVMAGLKHLLNESKISAIDISVVVHGTTLATNAVIERTGAKTGLLTTAGFSDVLAIGREFALRLLRSTNRASRAVGAALAPSGCR